MILPSKHLSQDRALLTVGARILQIMQRPMTVSALWNGIQQREEQQHSGLSLSYDGFVLTLDLLFLIGAIELEGGLLSRKVL